MARTIKFYFDFLSPYSYLALTQLDALAARTGSGVEFTPISVLAVMKLTDNSPTTILSKVKGAYAMADIARWVQRYGVPFGRDRSQRKVDDERLLAGAAIAGQLGEIEAYTRAVFGAVWGDGPAIADDGVLAQVLRAGGVTQVDAILVERERGGAIIEENVRAAAKAGVFGTPSFIVDGELFFGNDRQTFLEEALAA